MEQIQTPQDTPSRNVSGWIVLIAALFLLGAQLAIILKLSDLHYVQKVFPPVSFGTEVGLLFFFSVAVVLFLPRPHSPHSLVYRVMKIVAMRYVFLGCFVGILGSLICISIYKILLLSLPFSLILYCVSIVLAVVIMYILIWTNYHLYNRSNK